MDKAVVFYDGDCGFCNKSVQYILKHEKKNEMLFSPLQSEYTKQVFAEHGWPEPDLSTFYFLKGKSLYAKSTAALKVSSFLKFPYNFMVLGWIIPRFLRDKCYDFIANRRHKLAAGFCMFPSPEQKKRFIQ